EGLLRSVLEVRLLEEGELAPRKQLVEIAALVADAASSLNAAGETALSSIRAAVPPGLTAALDRDLVRRALENLIANAIKYSPRPRGGAARGRPAPRRALDRRDGVLPRPGRLRGARAARAPRPRARARRAAGPPGLGRRDGDGRGGLHGRHAPRRGARGAAGE